MTETSTKFDSLTAEPVEKLSSNPSQGFEFLNSAEMAAAETLTEAKPEMLRDLKKFAPEPRAVIREDAPKTLECLTIIELMSEKPREENSGKPACGWSTPKIYSLNEAMMRL